jgi:heat shock protein HtpX
LFAQPIMVHRRLTPLDEAERRRHKIRNVMHSILLLGGTIVLLALCGWVLFGVALVIVGWPLWLSGASGVPLLLIPLLVFAPQITTLLQLALSRAREFDADLDDAGLTGDPEGLASALAKLERYQRSVWEQILFPGYRLPQPSVLRSHPPTEERVARLRSLSGAPSLPPLAVRRCARIEAAWPMVHGAPHGRLIGYWY